MRQPYTIFPLGDSAITIDFGNRIAEDINKTVLAWFRHFKANPIPSIKEIVPAYCSLTFHYDINAIRKSVPKDVTAFDFIKESVESALTSNIDTNESVGTLTRIPVCYDLELAPDLPTVARMKNITAKELINYHTAKEYRVYMLGFLPGFAYLGQVDEAIRVPRKSQPVPVAAGSIGIAGEQTGLYPINSPGGWQIIGRTPLSLFDPNKTEAPALLKPGDSVQFYSISRDEFENF